MNQLPFHVVKITVEDVHVHYSVSNRSLGLYLGDMKKGRWNLCCLLENQQSEFILLSLNRFVTNSVHSIRRIFSTTCKMRNVYGWNPWFDWHSKLDRYWYRHLLPLQHHLYGERNKTLRPFAETPEIRQWMYWDLTWIRVSSFCCVEHALGLPTRY